MPFGLRKAPAVFQKMIGNVMGYLLVSFCAAYMNDILIFSKDRSQHTNDVKKVLDALSSSYLRLKPLKCELYKERVVPCENWCCSLSTQSSQIKPKQILS